MKLIAFEGLLYRGEQVNSPGEIWDYPRKRWVPYHHSPFYTEGAREIDPAEAEALKVDNPDALHFMYYDDPPWRQPMSPEARERYFAGALPEHLRFRGTRHHGDSS